MSWIFESHNALCAPVATIFRKGSTSADRRGSRSDSLGGRATCSAAAGFHQLLISSSWLFVLAAVISAGHAQEPAAPAEQPPVPAAANQVTLESVERQLKEVDGIANLDDAAREELRGVYQEAIRDLNSASTFQKQAASFADMAKNAGERLQAAKFQMSAMGSTVTIDVPPDATQAKLEELRNVEVEKLAEAKRQREQLEAEPGRRQARRVEIPGKIQGLRDARQKLAAELAAVPAGTDPKTIALRTRLQAKILAADEEIKLYEQELAAYTATSELLPVERDLAQRNASLVEKRVTLWREKVEERRTQEVEQQAINARMEAERTTGALHPLAMRNSELAQRSSDLAEKIRGVNLDLDRSRELLNKTEQQFKVTKEKVDRVGLNYAIGMLLRKEDSALPDVSKYRRNSRVREETIRAVQLEIIDLAEERSLLTDVDYVDSFVRGIASLPQGITRDKFAQEVRKLVDKRLDLLATLQQNQDAYFEQLVDLESTEQQLLKAVAEYEKYIDERVLWIRSSEPIAADDFRHSVTALRWFVDGESWSKTIRILWNSIFQQLFLWLLTLAPWLALLAVQPRLRRAVTIMGERSASGSCRSFLPTLMALLWTLLITALWPALILWISWRLAVSPDVTSFVKAVSTGLMAAGVYYAATEFLRQVCRTRGLADSHFDWAPGFRTSLRGNLRWMMAASVPMVFAAAMLYDDAGSRSGDTLDISRSQVSLARLFVMGVLLAVLIFAHRTLKPSGVIFRSVEAADPASRFYRYRRTIYTTTLLLLGLLLALAVVGYDFTVTRLIQRSFETAVLLEVLTVTLSLLKRWLIVVRRRMAIERAQQRRSQTSGQSEMAATLASISLEERTPDLTTIGEQSRRLLQFLLVIAALGGLWIIWIDVLPALSFLERFELWTVTSGVNATTITLKHLVVACIIVMATMLATKNIPGLLEIAVLSRLPLDAGNRYAIITICRYVIIILGLILAFGSIGVPWTSYQWLVAAVSVGLGFGLQEIFANFVSGLIVLFEQPIRVGDIVTIGDVTGIVSRIRMRATTVTNWEHQEFIVPNREFITGSLLNWTLSNTINRVVISVGVAYGTDPNLARQILLDIARQHPIVLDDPAPNVTFAEFGDSTLNIVLRCYLPNLENRLATIHELNTAAQRELNAAGIEFAFPTRELYIRSAAGAGSEGPLPPKPEAKIDGN